MGEKPLATTIQYYLRISRLLKPCDSDLSPTTIFTISPVLHYSPHNILLRKLLFEVCVVGERLSIEHTHPLGWLQFSHSHVR